MEASNDKLAALFAEYRSACPDPEPSADFMPRMWQKIEAQRAAMTFTFRRVVQTWVFAAVTLAIVLGTFVIPYLQNLQIYGSSYVDVLAAEHPNTYVDILNGDIK